jgi:hypothetical protein
MKPAKREYPVDRKTVRPFRIWNAHAKKPMPHRYFAYSWTAIDAVWKDAQWVKAGVALEVYDTTRPRALALAVVKRRRGGEFSRWVHPAFNFKHVTKAKPKRARRPKLRVIKGGKR